MELQGEMELCRGTGITISGLCVWDFIGLPKVRNINSETCELD